jgi:hypothetical protein
MDTLRVREKAGLKKKEKTPRPIEEYEFFVREGAGPAEAAPQEALNVKGMKGKSGELNKGGGFFSSGDDTDT